MSEEVVYIPIKEMWNSENFVPIMRKLCLQIGVSFPALSFPARELPRQRLLNLERIRKIRDSRLSEAYRAPLTEFFEAVDGLMKNVGLMLQEGQSADRRSILREWRSRGLMKGNKFDFKPGLQNDPGKEKHDGSARA